jgi:hypothetical protein
MVVLDIMSGQAVSLELVLAKGLHEKATGVLENVRHEYHNVSQES